jgi:cytochrome c-type biogenesis protein CcmE
MRQRTWKAPLLVLGVVATMGFLLAVALRQPGTLVYYLTVEEFRASGATHGDHFRVNGKVKQGTIERLPTGQDVRFVMTDGHASLPVAYHGIVPDTFVDGADVVVEGALLPSDTFEASTLHAKCPSKYEAAASERAAVRDRSGSR